MKRIAFDFLSRMRQALSQEEGQALTEQALLIAALLGIPVAASLPFTADFLAALREHFDWVRFVVEAPFP